jgi:hypothetical protein
MEDSPIEDTPGVIVGMMPWGVPASTGVTRAPAGGKFGPGEVPPIREGEGIVQDSHWLF